MLGDEISRTGRFLYHPALRGNRINLLVYNVVVRTNDVRVSAISVVANDDLVVVSMLPVFSGMMHSHRMGLPVYLQSALWLL